MKHFFLPLLFLISIQTSFAQFSWNAEANLQTMAGTEDELPFWMVHNQRGRILEDSNITGWITGRGSYIFSNNSILEIGAGVLAREGSGDNFFMDELYAHYETKWWSFTAGRKQQEELYNGLSASNRSILWSLNARPLPGLQLKTIRPVFLLKNFGFEAAWEEYLMDDKRFVENALLHHKSLHLIYSTADRNFIIKAGIRHLIQWSGESPLHGKQPSALEDYYKLILGQSGSNNASLGDQLNALGNHIGGYNLTIKRRLPSLEVEIFYQHLFEDGSGRRLGNTPDGRYGLFLDFKNKKIVINSLIYEFYYTKHQSHTSTGLHKWDNYFNNYLYRSGFTYNQQVIGAPFFLPNYYTDQKYDHIQIGNNKFIVHHLGLSGKILNKPYKLLMSYRNNYGHSNLRGSKHYPSDDYRGKYKTDKEVFSSYFTISILNYLATLNILIGGDFSKERFNGGMGLNLEYKIN